MPARRRWPISQPRSPAVLACFRAGRQFLAPPCSRPAHRPHPVRRHQGRPPPPRLSHDRLEAILSARRSSGRSSGPNSPAPGSTSRRSPPSGRPARHGQAGRRRLPCIVGTPKAGEVIGEELFDGETEAAIFPGDLPADPAQALDGSLAGSLRFVRFRPPKLDAGPLQSSPAFPHIRLDRSIEFLIGDRFR